VTKDSGKKTSGKAGDTAKKVSRKSASKTSPKASPRASRKVSKKARKKTRKRIARGSAAASLRALLPFLPIFGPPLVTVFIYMWIYTHMNIISIPARELRQQKERLHKENDSIRLRVEELQSLGRIERIARTKLGMISPQDYRQVALDESMWSPEDFSAGPGVGEGGPQATTGSKDAPESFKVGSAVSVRQPG
jgi:cell division protein FtsB